MDSAQRYEQISTLDDESKQQRDEKTKAKKRIEEIRNELIKDR